jgi:hypothetical protein
MQQSAGHHLNLLRIRLPTSRRLRLTIGLMILGTQMSTHLTIPSTRQQQRVGPGELNRQRIVTERPFWVVSHELGLWWSAAGATAYRTPDNLRVLLSLQTKQLLIDHPL